MDMTSRFLNAALALALLALSALPAAAEEREIEGPPRLHEWLPPGFPAGAPYPVILFSHGLGGCGTQSRFLTEALAEHGYVVLAPDHADARCGGGGLRGRLRGGGARPESAEARLGSPASWTEDTERDRARDLEAALSLALSDPETGAFLDTSHMGLAGHSLGGYTAMGLAGAWPSWTDRRFRAVLALSPYAAPFNAKGTLGGLGMPVMYQTGTRDLGIAPTLLRGGAYDATPSPKYLVEFQGAGHFAWTDLQAGAHQPIIDWSLAFLDRYVRGLDAPLLSAETGDGIASIRADP
jgi:predicted dienelactone hydrolase